MYPLCVLQYVRQRSLGISGGKVYTQCTAALSEHRLGVDVVVVVRSLAACLVQRRADDDAQTLDELNIVRLPTGFDGASTPILDSNLSGMRGIRHDEHPFCMASREVSPGL